MSGFVVLRMDQFFVKVCALEVPPPGVELNTVTEAVPVAAMSAAVIAAVNWVEETNVVVRFDPFQRTLEPATKLLPLTVSVNAGPPAFAVAGLRLVVVGTGLLIVKVRELEVPPPGAGLNTVTEAVPATAMSAAVITAVNRVEETKVVVRFAPFHRTIEPATKLLPLTVRTKSVPPAVVDVGLKLEVVGVGLLIVQGQGTGCATPGSRGEYRHRCCSRRRYVRGRYCRRQSCCRNICRRAVVPFH